MTKPLLAFCEAVFLFASCADDRSASVADIVSQWEGREILFPENSVFTIQGRDTVDFQFQDAPYKILTYVDSVGCMSCKLQLMNWSKYIQELDSVTGNSVPVAFFINASDQKELSYITRRDGFKHPVCFDEKDKLNSLNQFSADMTFQTFLLDGQNRVVGIGNPVHNANVKALYYRIINGEGLPEASSRAKTSLALEANEIDFGRFGIDEAQMRKVQVTNTGSELLVINDVTTSCGCTEVEFSREPVRPGQSTELTVRYNPDEKGFFSKTISIYSNAGSTPATIVLKGNVE
ncbi:MAG: DUF1573 domain-containing protein [Bacteroidaceae bacterium]|nr:DUF1573 domain-containing protein [Bacteroidaceae bacterium]